MIVDQCLFGYEDGHRLLASSVPLGDEASLLAELSDLAPGTVFGRSDGYWTGVPAPALGRYALMRTWPAPEMSRPGCVWTHGLLLDPVSLGELLDLSALMAYARRPATPADRGSYREALFVEVKAGADAGLLHDGLLRLLLDMLYGSTELAVVRAEPGGADAEVFAVWSQQWPRLRRNFRFQTAVTRGRRPTSAARLDLSFQLREAEEFIVNDVEELTWLSSALSDVRQGPRGALRSFLRQYGADVRRQRGSFRPLVEIKLLDEKSDAGAGSRLLELVTSSFPEPKDAARLKQDIVDGLLVPAAQLEVLWFVLSQGGGAVFPSPTSAGIARLEKLWPVRPDDMLHLAERTAGAREPLGVAIFETVTGAIPLDEFWTLTASFPRIRGRMVQARPELLLSDGLLSLDNAAVASMVELVPAGSGIGNELIGRLLDRDDVRLADAAFDRFPSNVASQVVAAMDGGSMPVGRAWLRELVARPTVLLDPVVMSGVSRTSLLYELAEALNWLAPDVVTAGTDPWMAALVEARNDLSDDRRDVLRSFLLALALSSGGRSGRLVLEKFFDPVHEQILKSRLPWRARDILSPLLPDIGWSRSWDIGLRLRLAVAAAYIRYSYPPSSYAALASGKKTRLMLADAANSLRGGEPFAMGISG